ncbi:MAG: response regulator [Elusimicrobia bacterium]|nr:response regulator [Elusimicrobiota bacterium]
MAKTQESAAYESPLSPDEKKELLSMSNEGANFSMTNAAASRKGWGRGELTESAVTAGLTGLETAINADVYYSPHGQPVNIPKEIRLRQLNTLQSDILFANNLSPDFVENSLSKIKNLFYELSPELKAAELYNQKTPSGRLDMYMQLEIKKVFATQGFTDDIVSLQNKYYQDKKNEKIFVIVNDNEEEANNILNFKRYNVRYFKDGGAALKFINNSENKKDIIVLTDLVMYPKDGLTLLREIKKIDDNILVLAAGSGITKDNTLSFIQNGFDGAIGKYDSVTFAILVGSLKNFRPEIEPELLTESVNFFKNADFEKEDIEKVVKYYELLWTAEDIYYQNGDKKAEDFINSLRNKAASVVAAYYYKNTYKAYKEIIDLPDGAAADKERLINNFSEEVHILYGPYCKIREKSGEINKELIGKIKFMIKEHARLKGWTFAKGQ